MLTGAPMWFDSAGLCIAFLERVKLPIFSIAQPRREALTDHGEQSEDVIAGAACVGEVLLDIEHRILIE